MKSLNSPDSNTNLVQIGKQLNPRSVFNGLKDAFGDRALCVQDEEWRAEIQRLKEADQITTVGINWYVEGWSERVHLVNKVGRLVTVETVGERFAITTAAHWARTNRDKSRLAQRRGRDDGEDYIIQEIPGIPADQFPVRDFRATTEVIQPELGLLTASRIIGNRVLTTEAGKLLLLQELWALEHEYLGYGDAGYNGEKLYRDESMPGLITAELLSSFTESL